MMTLEPRRGMTSYKPRDGAPVFLSDMIIELGLADAAHVEAAVETARSSGETVGHILVREGRLSEEQLAQALAARYGLNHIHLNEFEVDPAAANLLPPAAAQRYRAVPVSFEPDGGLLVAMADPSDSLALNDIAFMTRLEVQAAVAAENLIVELVRQLPLPPSETGGSGFPMPAQAAPEFAPPPAAAEPVVDHREQELAALRAELDATSAALDAERSEHAQAVAELRQQLAGEESLRAELEGLRGELAAEQQRSANSPQLDEAERRVGEAHATLERMRHDFELEREQHAATERDLRARLASESERQEALQEAEAVLQKRVEALRAQNAALLDAYATAKRWSAEFARGARELADTLEQPVLDDAVRAQQTQQDAPRDESAPPPAPPREGGRFAREEDDQPGGDDTPPQDWLT